MQKNVLAGAFQQKKMHRAAFRQKTPLDNWMPLCYTIQALEVRSKYRGVEQLEARRAHNPEVVGSSPASATIKKHRISKEIRCFSNFLTYNYNQNKIIQLMG